MLPAQISRVCIIKHSELPLFQNEALLLSALQTAYQRSQNVLVSTKRIMNRVRSVTNILMICLRYLLHNNISKWSMHCNNISGLGWVIIGRPCTLWLMQCTCSPLCYCPLCYCPLCYNFPLCYNYRPLCYCYCPLCYYFCPLCYFYCPLCYKVSFSEFPFTMYANSHTNHFTQVQITKRRYSSRFGAYNVYKMRENPTSV